MDIHAHIQMYIYLSLCVQITNNIPSDARRGVSAKSADTGTRTHTKLDRAVSAQNGSVETSDFQFWNESHPPTCTHIDTRARTCVGGIGSKLVTRIPRSLRYPYARQRAIVFRAWRVAWERSFFKTSSPATCNKSRRSIENLRRREERGVRGRATALPSENEMGAGTGGVELSVKKTKRERTMAVYARAKTGRGTSPDTR